MEFEGNVEEEMMMNFVISYTDVFGNHLSHNLKEDGENIRVTNENRQVRSDFATGIRFINRSRQCDVRVPTRWLNLLLLWLPHWHLTAHLCDALCLARNLVHNAQRISRRTRITTRWRLWEKVDDLHKKWLVMALTRSDYEKYFLLHSDISP